MNTLQKLMNNAAYGNTSAAPFDVDTDTLHRTGIVVDEQYRKDRMLKLAIELGIGQARMRSKQGVFYPTKIAQACAMAHGYAPPDALVVQFDKNCRRTTFPVKLAGAR